MAKQIMTAPAPRGAPTSTPAAAPVIPFLSSSHWHVEPAQFDVTLTPSTVTQQLGPFDIPSGGFFKDLLILVEASGGVVGPGVLASQAPWNIFQQIALNDVNGAQLVGPFPSGGWAMYLANLFGGYEFTSDLALSPSYQASGVTISFILRIPLEYHKAGRGALPNQDSSAKYKLSATLNTIANIWSAAPTTPPNLRFRGYLRAWTMPGRTDMMGQPQAQIPPAYGTTQYWQSYTTPVSVGQNIIPIRKVGNRIRTLLFYFSKAGAPATAAQMPDPVELDWDQRVLFLESYKVRQHSAAEGMDSGYASGVKVFPASVIPYSWAHDEQGHIGGIGPDMFLPTVQGTRLDFTCTIPAGGADTVEVIVNDVAGVEVSSDARYTEPSATTFHPATGAPVVAP